jgi:hypothetical protein
MSYTPAYVEKPAYKATLTYTDSEGEVATTEFYWTKNVTNQTELDENAFAQGVADSFTAASYATLLKLTLAREFTFDLQLPGNVTGATDASEDKAFIQIKAPNGRAATFKVPAPINGQGGSNSIFMGDGETVDAAEADVVNLITSLTSPVTTGAVTYTPSTVSGDPLRVYIKGERLRSKTRRKQRGGIGSEMGG